MSQFNFFDVEQQLAKIYELNGFLPKLSQLIDFEIFRPLLEEARPNKEQPKGGRPPYDNVLLFKILVLKHLYNLSDKNTEAQIRDRLSFMHFLGLTIADRFPDARTLWLFGEQLKEHNIERKVFDLFNELLTTQDTHNSFSAQKNGQSDKISWGNTSFFVPLMPFYEQTAIYNTITENTPPPSANGQSSNAAECWKNAIGEDIYPYNQSIKMLECPSDPSFGTYPI